MTNDSLNSILVRVTHESGRSSPYDGYLDLSEIVLLWGDLALEAAAKSLVSGVPESNNHGLLFKAIRV